jgi:hypothetical protein
VRLSGIRPAHIHAYPNAQSRSDHNIPRGSAFAPAYGHVVESINTLILAAAKKCGGDVAAGVSHPNAVSDTRPRTAPITIARGMRAINIGSTPYNCVDSFSFVLGVTAIQIRWQKTLTPQKVTSESTLNASFDTGNVLDATCPYNESYKLE